MRQTARAPMSSFTSPRRVATSFQVQSRNRGRERELQQQQVAKSEPFNSEEGGRGVISMKLRLERESRKRPLMGESAEEEEEEEGGSLSLSFNGRSRFDAPLRPDREAQPSPRL